MDYADHCEPADNLTIPEGTPDWVRLVEATGGDPPGKVADLMLRLVSDDGPGINGQLLWIEDGL